MKMKVLRTAQTIKLGKEDNIFYGDRYDIRAFYNPKIQATMVRMEDKVANKVAYTTFANIAYCEVDDEEFILDKAKKVGK